jgi:RNA polymerase sigma factor for flagellar operon FliA
MVTFNDEAALFEKFLEGRDPELREQIILQYVPLVHYVLGRFGISQNTSTEYEDLVSQGLLGLINAVDRYDPAYGTRFSTYATVRIRGTVQDHLRNMDWLSRSARRRTRQVQEAINALWGTLHRAPTEEELAEFLQVDVAEVFQGLQDSSRVIVSLDSVFDSTGDEETSLYDRLADENQPLPDETLDEKEIHAAVVTALKALPERDQLILSLYYFEELTLKEIGKVLDISESRVSQLHGRSVLTLRIILRQVDGFAQSLAKVMSKNGDSAQAASASDRTEVMAHA